MFCLPPFQPRLPAPSIERERNPRPADGERAQQPSVFETDGGHARAPRGGNVCGIPARIWGPLCALAERARGPINPPKRTVNELRVGRKTWFKRLPNAVAPLDLAVLELKALTSVFFNHALRKR